MRKVRINVTNKDIESGKAGCETRCPIARAVLRQFKSVTVHEALIYIERKKYQLPNKAIDFIYEYDKEWHKERDSYIEIVKPFSFTLNIRN